MIDPELAVPISLLVPAGERRPHTVAAALALAGEAAWLHDITQSSGALGR